MKEGFDKEIDSLLRRRAGVRVHSFDDGVSALRDEAHLDADELSAFAEGALPAAARVAVVSHLADCDECRGLAVNLTRALGTEAELEKRAVAASVPASSAKPARSWLSAIFAPRVLRYVAPALAVCLIAVVSFVALRTRRGADQLAQHAPRSESAPAGITQEQSSGDANATANANTDGLTSATNESASRNASAANMGAQGAGKGHGGAGEVEPSAPEDAKKDVQPAPPPPSKAGEAPAETAAVTNKPAEDEPREAAKTENKEKAAPRAVTNEDETVAAEQQPVQIAKRGNQSRGVEAQMPDGSRNQKRGDFGNTSNIAGGSLSSSAPREDRDNSRAAPGAPATRRARPSNEARAKNEADEGTRAEETRAAGHRFRRDGGAWVDVNYKSSMPQTGVRRGTEAFRALVADVPELGRVAEQLSGEVVVVVKGRAYRIR